jgi:serralysin
MATTTLDLAADASTSQALALGQSYRGLLETQGDVDWVKVDLLAGQTYFFSLSGDARDSVQNPYLSLLDSDGNTLAFNDNMALRQSYSMLQYTAETSGSYYIAAKAASPWDTGGYLLGFHPSMNLFGTVRPVFDLDAIANQLTHGYANFEGTPLKAFKVDAGNTISYSTGLLNANEIGMAKAALQAWSDIIGIGFTEKTGNANINFFNADGNRTSDAVTTSPFDIGVEFSPLKSVRVNIDSSWIQTNGLGLESYSYQTYVHEIGHALGLGHTGNYNGTADYPYNVLFTNDSYQISVMSYINQQKNWNDSASFAPVVTPMMADIKAMEELYGLSTTTRLGDTTYGFNSTAGINPTYDFSQYKQNNMVAMTLYDSGGVDTLDISGFGGNQTIDLTPGSFSSVANATGNVGIYLTTWIENAVGGFGIDRITGNTQDNRLEGRAGNDILSGGAGDDILIGGVGMDSLTGGTGADVFDFNAFAEMGLTAASCDRINDFNGAGGDCMDLSTLDADVSLDGDQAFVYIDTAAFSGAGQLRYEAGVLYGSTDADADAEFAIELVGAPALQVDYFVL